MKITYGKIGLALYASNFLYAATIASKNRVVRKENENYNMSEGGE